jgi:hypothetical protein
MLGGVVGLDNQFRMSRITRSGMRADSLKPRGRGEIGPRHEAGTEQVKSQDHKGENQ